MIDNFSLNEIGMNPDISFIIKTFEFPSKLGFDDKGLFYFDDAGDKFYCPEIRTSISDKGDWLSDKLPPIGFDIDQNGNVRKANFIVVHLGKNLILLLFHIILMI